MDNGIFGAQVVSFGNQICEMTDINPKTQLERIEAELRRLGVLVGPIQPAVAVNSAFGIGEMPFEDWLAKVFVPRAYEAASTDQWPPRSQVGVAAIRNFDGQDGYSGLVDLLCEFDLIVEAYGSRNDA